MPIPTMRVHWRSSDSRDGSRKAARPSCAVRFPGLPIGRHGRYPLLVCADWAKLESDLDCVGASNYDVRIFGVCGGSEESYVWACELREEGLEAIYHVRGREPK